MPTLAESPKFEIPTVPVRKFSVAEYHRMIAAGVLTENDAVELLEGWIVPKMPRNPSHDSTVQMIDDLLRPQLPAGWGIRIQMAVTFADSEPEPDVAVVLGDSRKYRQRHPRPEEIGLVIEVSDPTLTQDRTEKAAIYARAGIEHYWIVNLVDGRVETFSQPRSTGRRSTYSKKPVFRSGTSIPLILGDNRMSVPVDDLLAAD